MDLDTLVTINLSLQEKMGELSVINKYYGSISYNLNSIGDKLHPSAVLQGIFVYKEL